MLYLEIERVWRTDNTGEDLVIRLKTKSKSLTIGRIRDSEDVDSTIQRELGDDGFMLEQRWIG